MLWTHSGYSRDVNTAWQAVALHTLCGIHRISPHSKPRRSHRDREPLRGARFADRPIAGDRNFVKALNVGSTGGLAAAKRGECDIDPIHLLDPQSGEYNRPLLTTELELAPGYRRLQGIVFRNGDPRFEGRSLDEAIAAALTAPNCLMVNRNAGSGTRILSDRLLNGVQPSGYWSQPKSHNAVAVAVAQNRADWGIAIETVARQYGLGLSRPRTSITISLFRKRDGTARRCTAFGRRSRTCPCGKRLRRLGSAFEPDAGCPRVA
jgi:molybdate-binding protein